MGSAFAQSTANDVPFPNGFRDWFLVNTMIITKDSPIFDQIGGLHHIYVNKTAFPTLKAGGLYPYPDDSVFADDVHEFSLKDGSYVEDNKKAVTVMVKDPKKYASTGGWRLQVWAAIRQNRSSATRPNPASSVTRCKKRKTPHSRLTFPDFIWVRSVRLQRGMWRPQHLNVT